MEYGAFGVVIELDGRAFHASAAAWDRDHERDLDDHVAGRTAVRLGWGQVFQRSCRTAGKVGVILSRHGWHGTATPCGSECALGRGAPSPGQSLTR